MKVNKPTWGWKCDRASGWSFKVGEPHLEQQSLLGRTRARIDGQYSLHVIAASWKLRKGKHMLASSRSSQKRIDVAFARLDGIRLRTIELHKAGWVQRATFDEDTVLEITPLSWAGSDNVANWIVST